MVEDTKTAGPDVETADRLRSTELAAALDRLNPRMRHVLAQRFGLDGQIPQTLEEVGAGLGITRERVRQLESRALRELRMVAPGLEFYLRSCDGALGRASGRFAICAQRQRRADDSSSRSEASRFSESSSICRTRSRVSPSRRPISSSVFGSASVSP